MNKTLVIMAAGMGSRFGGLKQMQVVGPTDEFIIDYSIYDAKKAGFNKVVFVIKDEIFEDFKNTIGKRVENNIDVEYAFQRLDDIPVKRRFERQKPWGTGQAILCTKNLVDSNFAIINADDFYGFDAFKKASETLEKLDDKTFAVVGYKAGNTITDNGSVKRGICNLDENNKLSSLTESVIEKDGDKLVCHSLLDNEEITINFDTLVSMNMLLFTPKIYEYLENDFKAFLSNIKNEEKDEFLIPQIVHEHIKNGDVSVDVVETISKWYGVTYKDDTPLVVEAIAKMIESGEYPKNLWGN